MYNSRNSKLGLCDNLGLFFYRLTKIISYYLVEKKFLLVIDDLDALDAWEYVKRALPFNCKGKVVVTTHNPEISAALCQQNDLGDVLWPDDNKNTY